MACDVDSHTHTRPVIRIEVVMVIFFVAVVLAVGFVRRLDEKETDRDRERKRMKCTITNLLTLYPSLADTVFEIIQDSRSFTRATDFCFVRKLAFEHGTHRCAHSF